MNILRHGAKPFITVADYPNLRAYRGSTTKIFVSGTGVQGMFARVSSGTENGATLIQDSLGQSWQRLNVTNVIPTSWWEIGTGPQTINGVTVQTGYDSSGNYYDPANHSNGNGVKYFNDQFDSAHIVGGEGATILLPVNQTLLAYSSLNYTTHPNQTVKMQGSTVKRPDEDVLALAVDHIAGSTSCQLTGLGDPALRVGEFIQISDGNPDQAGHRGRAEITAIDTGTNTLTLGSSATNTIAAAGSVVTRAHEQFFCKDLNAGAKDWSTTRQVWRGGTFDGNQANNLSIKSWDLAGTADTIGAWVHIHHCFMRNTPSENIKGGLGIFEFNELENLGGSVVHFSFPGTKTGWSIARNNRIIGATNNRGAYNYLGHSEGTWVSSLNGFVKCVIEDNEALGGSVGDVYGAANFYIGDFISRNNRYAGHRNYMLHSSGSSVLQPNLTFDGDVVNSGDFRIQAVTGSAAKGLGVHNLQIRNCEFTNMRWAFYDCAGCTWNSNKTYTDQDNIPATWSSRFTPQAARMMLYNCTDWDLDGGGGSWLESPDPYRDEQRNGITYQSTIRLKDDLGADTQFYWSANIKIRNFRIRGFSFAISPVSNSPNIAVIPYMVVGHEITGNTVVGNATLTTQSAIQAFPSTAIEENTIFLPTDSNNTNQRGIIVHSIDDATNETKYVGTRVRRNTIIGSNNQTSIMVGNLSGRNGRNAIVTDNNLFKAIDDNGSNTTAHNNTTEAIAARTSPDTPPIAGYGVNQGVY